MYMFTKSLITVRGWCRIDEYSHTSWISVTSFVFWFEWFQIATDRARSIMLLFLLFTVHVKFAPAWYHRRFRILFFHDIALSRKWLNVTYMKRLKASSLYSVYKSRRLINYFHSKSNYSSGGMISLLLYFWKSKPKPGFYFNNDNCYRIMYSFGQIILWNGRIIVTKTSGSGWVQKRCRDAHWH